MASGFEKGVDFGLSIHHSAIMVEDKDPLPPRNYIFELLGASARVAGCWI